MSGIQYEYVNQGDLLVVRKTQDIEGILKVVHEMPDTYSLAKHKKADTRYMGSVPTIIGLQWAKESGTRYLSKEWREYAAKKLRTQEFSKLRLRF